MFTCYLICEGEAVEIEVRVLRRRGWGVVVAVEKRGGEIGDEKQYAQA